MHIHKNYLHDKTVLSLLAVNVTLFVVVFLSVLLRANSSAGETFVVQYRSNLDARSITSGPLNEIRVFLLFSALTLVASVVLSIRMYGHRRQVATLLLGITPFILLLAILISDRLIVSS